MSVLTDLMPYFINNMPENKCCRERKMPKQNTCFLSVIIIVYDRTNFIIDALKSLVSQTLNKALFEVILVTNIPLKIPDFPSLNLRIIESDLKKGTQKYKQGIENSIGQVICFLEDDDVFTPKKLEIVYTIFHNNKDIVFYKNQPLKTTDVARALKDEPIRSLTNQNVRFYKISDSTAPVIFWKARRIKASFNTSTMCVRKQYYDNSLTNSLLMSHSFPGDEVIFLLPFLSKKPVNIAVDRRKLTIYRLHESYSNTNQNFTHNTSLLKKNKTFLTFMKKSYEDLGDMFDEIPFIKRFCDLEQAAYSLRLLLMSNKKVPYTVLYKSFLLSFLDRDILRMIDVFRYFCNYVFPQKLNIKIDNLVMRLIEHAT